MLLIAATALLLVLGLSVAWKLHRRRRQRINLRLLAGRGHLLSEQIEERCEALAHLDGQLTAETGRAREALEELGVLLIERQSELLNFEDLAGLQDYKIDVLNAALNAAAAPAPSGAEATDAGMPFDDYAHEPRRTTEGPRHRRAENPPSASPSAEPAPPEQRDRAGLEQTVLQRINELNRSGKNKK